MCFLFYWCSTMHMWYSIKTVAIKDFNILIDEKSVKYFIQTFDTIRKIILFLGDDWKRDCLLDTARKTIFPKFWSIMERSRRPSKYHLSINFWLKKDRISHNQKVQNKNFLVISKYHLSINLLDQKKTVLTILEKFKTRTFQ